MPYFNPFLFGAVIPILGLLSVLFNPFFAPVVETAIHELPFGKFPVAITLPAVLEPISTPVPVYTAPVIPSSTAPQSHDSRLLIPKLGVNAVIKKMGLTSNGEMAVPNSNYAVSWYSPGTIPGEIGSAVIAGHNVWGQSSAVFERLDTLAIGDTISVIDSDGVTNTFAVREWRTFDPKDDASAVFLSNGGRHLNLITCSGVYDLATGTYTTRLVVFADLII